ncbi:hypothetical protein SAMN05216243_3644 [Sediminibacillus albus]|uniref:Uncharacterized protein n=1 Tax=Sediminibacillus albus TaxID=407036 RepID=A0A1G9D3F9_9BACI|nr:hypothetical protein SAMN05216243_3644 [Sediminibacillus albus]
MVAVKPFATFLQDKNNGLHLRSTAWAGVVIFKENWRRSLFRFLKWEV